MERFLFWLMLLIFVKLSWILFSIWISDLWWPGHRTLKSILIWNSAHRIETLSFGVGVEAFRGCPTSRCQIYVNHSNLPFEFYDAVVFNMHELWNSTLPEVEGYHRRGHQRYVFLTQESPQTMPLNASDFINYFNWTMSYRLNADIHLLYGRTRPALRKLPVRNYATGKTATAAWMVSHCETNSQRETYVEELRQYVDVEVFGLCNNNTDECPRNNTHWLSPPECYDRLAKRFKFYLAFENSLCRDYVTEKFYEALARDIVPVVYGAADYEAIAPPKSFINAMLFTPAELGRYLRGLAEDDVAYNSFFTWKQYYVVESGVESMSRHAFCDLCHRLHYDSSVNISPNLDFEWSNRTQCFHPAELQNRVTTRQITETKTLSE